MSMEDKQFEAKKQPQITPEMEQKMRVLANLIIDRIFEDKRNNALKFQSASKDHKKASKTSANDIGL